MKVLLPLFALLLLAPVSISAQPCNNLNLQHQADIASTIQQMTLTMLQDGSRPYLYVANKEGGLKIYDINNVNAPQLLQSIGGDSFQSLHVMNLSQQGNYLYLALGNHFGTATQSGGIAIVDVSNPAMAMVKGLWKDSSSSGGCGIVKTEGNYAYVGAMGRGLVILDISDKSNIRFVSRFVPDINYPTPNPNPNLYNARGMEVQNSIVYLCYDAGGFRIINCSNKQQPVETGRYSNPVMNGKPRAYNNIVLDDSLVYIAVDYCGLEVLNIRDTANIKLHAWWNPWNCQTNAANWFSSAGHTNEIAYSKECHKLFIATGKSDMYVVDVSNPGEPDSCNIYGGTENGIGTWGVSMQGNRLFLSYIITVGVPFASNWTGVKILTWTPCTTSDVPAPEAQTLLLFPNPAEDVVRLQLPSTSQVPAHLQLVNALGEVKDVPYSYIGNNSYVLHIAALQKGVYLLRTQQAETSILGKLIKY